jgi:hypothetical protein
MPDDTEHTPERLSAILRELGDKSDGHLRLGDVVERFGPRALGALLFLFGLLNLIPWPPGGTTITGTPLLLISAQVAFGARTLWLPKAMLSRGLDAGTVQKGLKRILPRLEQAERVSKPRLAWLFGPVGDRLIGLTCTLLAMIIVLPIFGGNFLPAVAVSVLALSLVQRDGYMALVGYALVAVTAAVLFLVAGVIIDGFQRAWAWSAVRFR